jgi:hypothetical protein
MTFETTDPQEFTIRNYQRHYISADGGDLTVKRKLEDGTWSEVEGSPVSDGEERILLTSTSGGKIQVTPSAIDTQMSLGAILE